MNLIKCDPLRELEDISNRLNRLFSRRKGGSDADEGMLVLAEWSPSADITETDSAYLIKDEIPGVNKEDVKVTVKDGLLSIQGERNLEKEEKGKKFHRVECSYGSFVRSFQIPDDAEDNSIKAVFKDGMLNVTLTKSTKAKVKSVKVKVT